MASDNGLEGDINAAWNLQASIATRGAAFVACAA
jgi:hypothetical protein